MLKDIPLSSETMQEQDIKTWRSYSYTLGWKSLITTLNDKKWKKVASFSKEC